MKLGAGLIVFLLFFISCNLKNSNENMQDDLSILEFVQPKIDSMLRIGVNELISSKEHLKYKIPLSESCLVILFTDNANKNLYYSDTTATISYYTCFFKDSNNGYKGILRFENYNIAIFDANNIGHKYYNVDSLEEISLDYFKCIPMDIMLMSTFYHTNGKLRYWNP